VTGPLADPVLEADRILTAAEAEGVMVRLIGGLAIRLLTGEPDARLARPYKDIDLVTLKGEGKRLTSVMTGLGYRANERFNAMQGHSRLLFYDDPNERQVDVFVGTFDMCHRIPITERAAHHPRTIPPAELLLTKLQVVKLNDKDLRDLLQLLLEVDLEEQVASGSDAIDLSVVAALCAADWGLWRTSHLNLDRVEEGVGGYGLESDGESRVRAAVATIRTRIDDEPKGRKWKLRDRVGDRQQWYEDPEEVG
jgi:hypothetical protein